MWNNISTYRTSLWCDQVWNLHTNGVWLNVSRSLTTVPQQVLLKWVVNMEAPLDFTIHNISGISAMFIISVDNIVCMNLAWIPCSKCLWTRGKIGVSTGKKSILYITVTGRLGTTGWDAAHDRRDPNNTGNTTKFSVYFKFQVNTVYKTEYLTVYHCWTFNRLIIHMHGQEPLEKSWNTV